MTTGIEMAGNNTLESSIGTSAVQARVKRGMVLPFQPLSLAFNHENYYVDMPAVSSFSPISHSIL